MSNSTILATISDEEGNNVRKVKIIDYESMRDDKNQQAIADMIYYRLYGRYIKPFMFEDERYKKHYKHGFAMMASACLLIEVLQSFYRGLEDTKGENNGQLFESFFENEMAMRHFKSTNFYSNVRCGILHQGETTGGFTISRSPKDPLFNRDKKRINAYLFLAHLEKSLKAYKMRLMDEEWDSEIWDNLRRKMRFIINHCKANGGRNR